MEARWGAAFSQLSHRLGAAWHGPGQPELRPYSQSSSDVRMILIMEGPALGSQRSLECQAVLPQTEEGLRWEGGCHGQGGSPAACPHPWGSCLSLCKNALLSPIKYASPPLNFNGPL